MSWLWNSMLPKISCTAKEMWETVRQTYSKVCEAAQIYKIKQKISTTKQGTRSVIEYYNLMKNLWQEMDYYQNLQMKCSEDAAMLRKFIEREQIFEFLADLNVEFDEVRVQVLGKEDLSSINEVFSIIGAEEGRRGVMIDSQPAEGSTLATTKPRDNNFKGVNSGQGGSNDSSKYDFSKNKDNVWCTYCKKPRHTKETCWKLHGKPQGINCASGFKWGQQ